MSSRINRVHSFSPAPDVAPLLAEAKAKGIDPSAAVNACLRRYFKSKVEGIINPTGELRGLFRIPSGYMYRETEAEAFQPLTLKDAATKAADLLDQRPHDLEVDLSPLLRDLAKQAR